MTQWLNMTQRCQNHTEEITDYLSNVRWNRVLAHTHKYNKIRLNYMKPHDSRPRAGFSACIAMIVLCWCFFFAAAQYSSDYIIPRRRHSCDISPFERRAKQNVHTYSRLFVYLDTNADNPISIKQTLAHNALWCVLFSTECSTPWNLCGMNTVVVIISIFMSMYTVHKFNDHIQARYVCMCVCLCARHAHRMYHASLTHTC